ncbi:hypothetical protein FSP39_010363 [Pinctada imbricata]|uniref:Solute carrier organic anion transporter family member n=1 Tax=Pinctada imbricata TaxID=66713 RepID=A0AA88XLV6_PINIB|nr:hypothetical protein FSP39_010363 [Pinctada imbricata]
MTEEEKTNGFVDAKDSNMTIRPQRLQEDASETPTVSNPEDIKCGFGSCKPNFLQNFNNPKALLFFLCAFCTVQGFVVNGVNNVNTTSLERRFGLPSSRVGMISSFYDISAAILGLIVSYLGSGKHKARWVAMACLSMACGSFFMALPHFTTGLYQWGQNIGEACRDHAATEVQCAQTDDTSHLQNYLYVFLFGQILHGVGGTTLYIVGVALIDDSVPASSSPMYCGILYAFATLGPALGYIVGGQMLDIYVDYFEVDGIALTPEDPRWVGAWWIGFVVAFVLFLAVSVPLFAYGSELPTAAHVRANRVSQTHNDSLNEKKEELTSHKLRDLPKSFILLMKNPAFLFITLAGTAEGFGTSGVSTFLPKLIQNQFGATAAWASILAGIIAVPGAAGGQFVGGLICKRMNLKVQGMIRLNIIVCFVAMVLDAVVWVRCDLEDIAGVTVHYSDPVSLPNVTSSCNSMCSCTTEYYEPVCSEHNIQYFSPCHAGCQSKVGSGYANCSCVEAFGVSGNMNTSNTVKTGKCSTTCNMLYFFLPVLLVAIFFRFVEAPPSLSITLRCIHDNQRTFALGIQWFVVRLLGTVPGPIFYGAVIDSTCLVWQEKCGDEQTSCWIYDNVALSRNFFLILICFKVFAGIMFLLAYKFYKPPLEKMASATYVVNSNNTNTVDSEDVAVATVNKSFEQSLGDLEMNGFSHERTSEL